MCPTANGVISFSAPIGHSIYIYIYARGGSNKSNSGRIGLNQIRLGQVRSGQVRGRILHSTATVSIDANTTIQCNNGVIRSDQLRPDQVRSNKHPHVTWFVRVLPAPLKFSPITGMPISSIASMFFLASQALARYPAWGPGGDQA